MYYILVPPRWTIEPSDANIAAGQEAVIHCQADGYPKPLITWKKAIGEYFYNETFFTFTYYILMNAISQLQVNNPGSTKILSSNHMFSNIKTAP